MRVGPLVEFLVRMMVTVRGFTFGAVVISSSRTTA